MKEKLESIEIYCSSLEETEKKLTKIFNEVMSGNIPLKRKVELRKESLRISIGLLKTLRECLALGKKELKRDKITNSLEVAITLLLTISSMVAFFFNPLISLVLIIFAMIKSLTKMNSLKNQIDSSKEVTKEVLAKFDQVSVLMDNIDRRLSLDIKINKDTDGEVATKQIDLANDVILEYLDTGNIKEVDNDIKLYIIKLLQSDLKDEENISQVGSLEELLKIAKDKVDRETKEQGIKLVKGE